MPLSTRRSFTHGTPRGLFGSIGLMVAHSLSVSSYRMIRSSVLKSWNHTSGVGVKADRGRAPPRRKLRLSSSRTQTGPATLLLCDYGRRRAG